MPATDAQCARCDKSFERATNWHAESSCCSRECSDALERTCVVCGAKWSRNKNNTYYYCSVKCAMEHNKDNPTFCPMFA